MTACLQAQHDRVLSALARYDRQECGFGERNPCGQGQQRAAAAWRAQGGGGVQQEMGRRTRIDGGGNQVKAIIRAVGCQLKGQVAHRVCHDRAHDMPVGCDGCRFIRREEGAVQGEGASLTAVWIVNEQTGAKANDVGWQQPVYDCAVADGSVSVRSPTFQGATSKAGTGSPIANAYSRDVIRQANDVSRRVMVYGCVVAELTTAVPAPTLHQAFVGHGTSMSIAGRDSHKCFAVV